MIDRILHLRVLYVELLNFLEFEKHYCSTMPPITFHTKFLFSDLSRAHHLQTNNIITFHT